METKQFKAESKRLLDLMINSIYTHREIFLRELISNASDAIDKIYYKSLSDDNINFNKENFFIKVSIDKENRTIKISDTGIGMSKEELDDNLGVIAKSGSLQFKKENEIKDGFDIIGQFGVGFYSSFLIADKVTVITKAFGSKEAYKWESTGVEGYTIEPSTKDTVGTDIILHVKANTDDENFDEYLNEYKIQSLIKKYSDFIRYPIKMNLTERKLKEGTESEYEDYIEEKVVNSMVPIWRKNKNELTQEDYSNFYKEKHYGFDTPLKHIHLSVDGTVSYNAILYIPENMPYDFYTKDYEKGLELYSNGVMIMNKCSDLLPDYFGFVKGIVDSEDLSLNISREILQHDRQLRFIAKNIKNKIKSELEKMLRNERENYEKFWDDIQVFIKFGCLKDESFYDKVKDSILFKTINSQYITLNDYLENCKEKHENKVFYVSNEEQQSQYIKLFKDYGLDAVILDSTIDNHFISMIEFKNQGVHFNRIDADLSDILKENDNEDNKEIRTDIENLFKDVIGDRINNYSVESLKSEDTPAIILISEQSRRMAEMRSQFAGMDFGMSFEEEKTLVINNNSSIVKKLVSLKDDESKKEQISLICNQIVDIALLSNKELDSKQLDEFIKRNNQLMSMVISL